MPLDRIADHLVGGSPLSDVLDIERTRLRAERRQIDEALQVIDTVHSMGALSPGRVQLIQRDDVHTLSARARAQPDTCTTTPNASSTGSSAPRNVQGSTSFPR